MSPLTETLLFGGLVGALPWWGYLTIGLVLTHLLVMSVSIYLHRGETHRAILVNPKLAIFFRLLFWLSQTSTVKEWVAVHRKHHRYVDRFGDPHSPRFGSLWKMLFATEYRKEAKNKDTLRVYGKGTPEDWLEKNVFTKYRKFGVAVLALGLISLFGVKWGVILWTAQVFYLPVVASFGVNGIGHLWGYRNFDTRDCSKNVLPFDPLACGEGLHNNHHADPNSAKFSFQPWEFDLGWAWITLFRWLGLVKVEWVFYPPVQDLGAWEVEDGAVRAFSCYMLHIRKKFYTRVQPALERMHGENAERLVAVLKERFDQLCAKTFSPKSLQYELNLFLSRANSINNKKLKEFCDWIISLRVPSPV